MSYRNYPLVTPEGVPVPIDLLEPAGILPDIGISYLPMSSAVPLPNAGIILLELWASVDCVIGFSSTPVDGITTLGTYRLRADDPRILMPIGGYMSGLSAVHNPGTLYVNLLVLWEATKKEYQIGTGE